MTGIPPEEKPLNIQALLGVGLDGRPDDVHITRGPNFYLWGGSKRTHEQMRESVLRLNDKVERRGKQLREINARELVEIAEEIRDEMARG